MVRGLVLAIVALALVAPSTLAAPAAAGCTKVAKPVPKPKSGRTRPDPKLDAKKRYHVILATNCGSFTIRLDVRDSPNTAASFAYLAPTHFFDRTIFHRIVPDFVIQGGDPTGTGTGGPGYSTVDRPPRTTVYSTYLVAMAKTTCERPGTAGSQFFVVTGATVRLPPDYAVLGRVFVGRTVVDRIGRLGDPNTEQPTQTVEILHASVRVR